MNNINIIISILFALTCTSTLAENSTMPTENTTSALIQKTKAVQREISKKLIVYGRVQPDPDAIQTISLPHAGTITKIRVRLGQRIKQGDTLFKLTISPSDNMEYMQASNAVNYAESKLARQQRLLQEQLTTKAEVNAVSAELLAAQNNLKTLEAQEKNKTIETRTAPTDGIITSLNIKQGDMVQANAVAMTIADGNKLIVQLGVEPEDIHFLKPGTPIKIHSVFIPEYEGKSQLREIHAMINPVTHLVDAIAPIPPDKTYHLVLGGYLTAEIQLSEHTGLTVPRTAVLEDEQGYYVFTIEHNKAKRLQVEIGQENKSWTEITKGLHQGQLIVITGNYVLTDGMFVREEK